MNSESITVNGCTRTGSRPVSSWASRKAVPTGPPSPGSVAPPGNDTCPLCWRRVDARTVSSRSASVGSVTAPSADTNTRTAAGRPEDGSLRACRIALTAGCTPLP
ncbi:Uncharacterised protein [Mycobacteroides abscessus subsp. abscessus]|nr:Uncharacterised protein [Mycobacteroides abscessus subsp. abscessus]